MRGLVGVGVCSRDEGREGGVGSFVGDLFSCGLLGKGAWELEKTGER